MALLACHARHLGCKTTNRFGHLSRPSGLKAQANPNHRLRFGLAEATSIKIPCESGFVERERNFEKTPQACMQAAPGSMQASD